MLTYNKFKALITNHLSPTTNMHIIREYTHTDVDAVKRCLLEIQEFERLMDAKRLHGLQVAHEYLEHILALCQAEKGKVFVVEINGGVVGMVSVVVEDNPRHTKKTRPFAVISDLMVLPEYRSEGVTKDLIDAASAYAQSKHVQTIQAHVYAAHEENLSGLVRNGFSRFELILRKHI